MKVLYRTTPDVYPCAILLYKHFPVCYIVTWHFDPVLQPTWKWDCFFQAWLTLIYQRGISSVCWLFHCRPNLLGFALLQLCPLVLPLVWILSVVLPGNTCCSLFEGFWPSEFLVVQNTVYNLCFTSLLRPRQSFQRPNSSATIMRYRVLFLNDNRSNMFKETWEQRKAWISDSCLVFIMFSCEPLHVFLAVSGNSVRKAGVEMEKGRLESGC